MAFFFAGPAVAALVAQRAQQEQADAAGEPADDYVAYAPPYRNWGLRITRAVTFFMGALLAMASPQIVPFVTNTLLDSPRPIALPEPIQVVFVVVGAASLCASVWSLVKPTDDF